MKTPPDDCNGLARLQHVVHDLRSPGGCPWDQEQTHLSLTPNMLEEAYEAVEAIQSGDTKHMCEELGDILLQVVLHAEIASETGAFDLDTIAHGIAAKLIHRHPHVYGESTAEDSAAVLKQWDEIKRAEKGAQGAPFISGITKGIPALSRAVKIQKKAAKVQFDWPDAAGVIEKIREETDEVTAAMAESADRSREEIGDLLFAVVNLARKLGHDPEAALAAANEKFIQRFTEMENALTKAGLSLTDSTMDEKEAAWQSVKGLTAPGKGA